jgi:hypothetical protein
LHVKEHPIWSDRLKTTVLHLPPEQNAAPPEAETKPL